MRQLDIAPDRLYRGRWGAPRMVERLILMPPRGAVPGVTFYRTGTFARGQVTLAAFAKWALEEVTDDRPLTAGEIEGRPR